MNVQYVLYLFPMILTFVLSIGIALFAWQRTEVAVSRTFAVFMIDVAFWSLMTGMLELSDSPEMALIWYKLHFVSITTVPVICFIFGMQFSRHDSGLTLWHILLLFLIPVLTLVIIQFRFDLFNTEVNFEHTGPLMLVVSDKTGPWFTLHLFYSLFCISAGVLLILIEAVQANHVYRWQALALLAGAIPPIFVGAWLATFYNSVMAHLIPLSFLFMGLVYTWALFRFRLLDLMPVAQNMLINLMEDGLLVFDNQQRIVEINHAAERLLDLNAGRAIGQTAAQTSGRYRDFIHRLGSMPDGQMEVDFGSDFKLRHLNVSITPVIDRRGHKFGRMVILRDVSDLFNAMQRLEMQLQEIRALQNELKEQAIRDPLTGLYNRRYLDETLDREFARALRENYSISLVMIDIDLFKQINDVFGHGAGDLILKTLADMLSRATRKVDIVCRMGGEEFMVVLPNATRNFACQKAETWREAFEEASTTYNCWELQATISLGVAAFPLDGSTARQVMAAADHAMYRAKTNGRNRVEMSTGNLALSLDALITQPHDE
ncbi:MAG: diguanylate cyclase [Anaerolineae bacterium]|nr:diguanylate cyclase [Anaerolineae bacterium]